MKVKIILILLAVPLFASGQSKDPITKPELLFVDTNIVFEHFDDVQAFQFFDNDSLKGKVTCSQKLDNMGNIVAEYYKDYKTDQGNGRVDVLVINEYNKNNKTTISTSYYPTFGEAQKTFFYYQDTLLIRTESFELKRRLKQGVDKGWGRPGGCVVTGEDYEKEPTWKLSRIAEPQYNDAGKKTLTQSPVSNSSHNGSEYQYDEKGRVIVEKSLDGSRLLYTKNYVYEKNKITSVLEWDNKNWSGTKEIRIFDDGGHLIKESIIQGDKEWVKVYQYNREGKLVRYMAYDSDGKINLTHIYKYKKK